MVPTITRVEQFFHASVARCQIRRNQRSFALFRRIGKTNLEGIKPLHGNFRNFNFAYLRSGGRLFRKSQHKPVERQGFTFGMHPHALNIVQNPTGNISFFCLTIDKGAETHPLYYARYFQIKRLTRHALIASLNALTKARIDTAELSGKCT